MIKINNLKKSYNDNVIYNDFSAVFEENKITVILGESGSGKTTLLNVLLNLTDYSGSVEIEKPVSMVFQRDSLVKNLTVEENLRLVNKTCDIDEILKDFSLEEHKNKKAVSLSGGMARRVAIIRALIYNSKTVLMDEPLINLDYKLKFKIIEKIKEYQKATKKTMLIVSHDITEAVNLADRIVVLKNGAIVYDNKDITQKTERELLDFMLNI